MIFLVCAPDAAWGLGFPIHEKMHHHNTPLVFWKDQWVPQSEARLPINDAGFVWGATLTDLCRTVKHQLYRWPEHLARFRQSCRAAGIYPPFSEEEIDQYARNLVSHNVRFLHPQEDLTLVVLVTPGPIGYYGGESGEMETGSTFFMHTFPLPFKRYRRYFEQGVRLAIPSTRHVPPVCLDPKIKQRSRLHWWIAEQEARRIDPQASALLLDLNGHITETAAANFLLVKEGRVFSPPLESILNGVSLQVVRELCDQQGIPFLEKPLTFYDCINAGEARLTNSSFCLAGVSLINGVPLPWPGEIFHRLLQAWSEEIQLNIAEQFKFVKG